MYVRLAGYRHVVQLAVPYVGPLDQAQQCMQPIHPSPTWVQPALNGGDGCTPVGVVALEAAVLLPHQRVDRANLHGMAECWVPVCGAQGLGGFCCGVAKLMCAKN